MINHSIDIYIALLIKIIKCKSKYTVSLTQTLEMTNNARAALSIAFNAMTEGKKKGTRFSLLFQITEKKKIKNNLVHQSTNGGGLSTCYGVQFHNFFYYYYFISLGGPE